MTTMMDKLKRQLLLEGLSDKELEVVSGTVEIVTVSQGDPVFRENEPTRGVYMINFGNVEVTKKLPIDLKTKMLITVRNLQNCCEIRKTPYGWRQKFADLVDGQFFGELSVIEDRKKHGADADAADDTELLLIPTDKFKDIEARHPAIMLQIYRTVAKVSSKNVRHLDRQLLTLLIGY
jgi:CRP-like cAMP-binding protein